MNITSNRWGFTLIEVLLVIGVLGLIVALATPFYQSFQISSELDNTTHELISALRQTQAKAMASEGFRSWGVHLEKKAYIIFSGDKFNPDDKLNQRNDLAGPLSIEAENTDIVFSSVEGQTSNTGKITLISVNKEARTLTINSLGAINAN